MHAYRFLKPPHGVSHLSDGFWGGNASQGTWFALAAAFNSCTLEEYDHLGVLMPNRWTPSGKRLHNDGLHHHVQWQNKPNHIQLIYLLVNVYNTLWLKSPCLMGKLNYKWVIFSRKLLVYQRVSWFRSPEKPWIL